MSVNLETKKGNIKSYHVTNLNIRNIVELSADKRVYSCWYEQYL